jgi:menaquinol-cytochrome c reductase cytochrome b/c subunit
VTEIPEHLLKRAQAAREKAAVDSAPSSGEPEASTAAAGGGPDVTAAGGGPEVTAEQPAADPRIPAHLLERSRAAKAKAEGAEGESGGGGAVAVADRVAEVVQIPPAAAGVPVGAGPGGHTQRLLTVVKSGSIQEVKASPIDKVHTWPHLLAGEFVAALLCTAFTFVFSIFVNAPLLQLANVNQTPNPSKAPWYFLGLQELLTMFHPMIAGVTIPGVGIIVLIFAPYIDKNPSNKPEDRKFATALMTVHLMFWAVLVIIGSFFRGPGFNFTLPWKDGVFFDL